MKFLIVPGNNSLSHVAKCLALQESLRARGHDTLVAVSARNSAFLDRLGIPHEVLPDIQENDGSALPTVEWFRNSAGIERCIRAEMELIARYAPDRVIGVFRFTLKAASAALGVPFDSLACGCMIPGTTEVLGFGPGEPGREAQRIILDGFYRYGALRTGEVLGRMGLPEVSDIREMLVGEHTFLWDMPGFHMTEPMEGVMHIGPIAWDRWPYEPMDIDAILKRGKRVAA